MSDSTVHNLLREDVVKDFRLGENYTKWPGYYEKGNWTQWAACTPGKEYTLSTVTNVAGEVCFGFYLADDSVSRPNGYEIFPAGKSVVRTLTAPAGAKYVAASWADGNRRPMVVEGDTPAAWAPAEGETLVGVGARISANLLAGVEPSLAYGSMADGVITSSTPKADWKDVAIWPITTDMLAENQTVHIGISAKWHGAAATKGTVYAAVKYADAAGSTNNIDIKISGITTEWKRFSLSAVVPSGMHIVDFHISGNYLDASYDATNPVLSYGSPVCLASSAHTPYATQDHLRSEYATKAALKVTSDAVTAEVEEHGKLAGRVGTLESTSGTHTSRLEQLASSIKSLVKGESTYTDPDGKSATSGIYSLVTQTRDTIPYCDFSVFRKFGVIGDSYASGELYFGGHYVDAYFRSWGQILARMCGNTCTNYSRGGLTTKTWLASDRGLSLVNSSDPEDLYILALGINDYAQGLTYLGTIKDITSHESYADYADSFYGNYGRIIEQVMAYAPHAKLVMFTCAATHERAMPYNDAIEEIASHYGLPCVRLYDDPFFQSYTYTHMSGGHPRAVAYSGMAITFKHLVEDAMVTYSNYFDDLYMYSE